MICAGSRHTGQSAAVAAEARAAAAGRARGLGVRLALARLVLVLVGLDQPVQDPGEVGDVAGGQRLDEVAPDPVGVIGPDLLEPAAPVRGERYIEPAAVGGADRAGDEPIAFHAV